MRKLISLNETDTAHAETLMSELHSYSFSELFRALMVFYDQNKKRPAGRPKGEPDGTEEDDVNKYVHPDKDTKGPYSFNEIAAYCQMNKLAPPDRSKLKIHPDYKS